MHWWLIIIALWVAPAIALGVVLLLSVWRDKRRRDGRGDLRKPKSSTRTH